MPCSLIIEGGSMVQVISGIGFIFFLSIAFLLSENRRAISWPVIFWGVGLQFIFGVFILKTPWGFELFNVIGTSIQSLLDFTKVGSRFIFGNLTDSQGSWGYLFFTMVLPSIIFMSALMSALYHLGVMQKIVYGIAWVMMKTMKISGAESIAAAANIFMGQTEAPLVIKPYIALMTRSEIMSLMTGGMATVAGGVLVAYVGFGVDPVHLLAASVMSAPAAIMCAKLMVPETQKVMSYQEISVTHEKKYQNVIEAAATGAAEGLKLAANVAAMLLAFIALIAMLNAILASVGQIFGISGLSFEFILGYINAPIAWMMGVSWQDAFLVGQLLGKKLVINEFVAYLDLMDIKAQISQRSVIIATYALCGFANFSSIAIQIGGIGSIAPHQKSNIAKYGLKSLLAGTLACYLTACVVGILIGE